MHIQLLQNADVMNPHYLLFFFFLPFQLPAQTYLNPSSTWTENYGSCGFTGTCDSYNYTNTISGDTVIQGNTYYKILSSGTHSVYNLSLGMVTLVEPFTWDIRFIREQDHLLYWYRTSIDQDILLADFDLEVGDTAVSRYCQNPLIVDHLDTIYLGSAPRRRYWFSPGNNHHNYLIEGVGASGGLFTNPCSEIGIESGSILECFQQSDASIILDSSAACSLTSISESRFTNHLNIKVYPNPVAEVLFVVLPDEISGDVDISMYSITGQKLISQDYSNTKEIRLNVSGFVTGIYLLHILTEAGEWRERIMINMD